MIGASQSYITIVGSSYPLGSAAVSFNVAANTGAARQAIINVQGVYITVSQAAASGTQPVVTLPAAPQSLAASAVSSSQINLSWVDASSNETGFVVERAQGTGSFASIANLGAGVQNYSATGLSPATQYSFRVKAMNSAGSVDSNIATATTQAAPITASVPNAPSNATAQALSISQIQINWADNSNNESGFKVYRSTSSGGSLSNIGTVGANVTSFVDSGRAANTIYYYKVRSYNSAGNSLSYSNEASARTLSTTSTLPAAPQSLAAVAVSPTQINLTWVDASNNESTFRLERKISGGSYSTVSSSIAANSTSYNNTGLAANTSYVYRVRAQNSSGNSAYSNEVTVRTLALANVAPVARISGPTSGQVNQALSFSAATSSDSDGSIASYAWNFGDGTSSTLASPSKTYAAAGTYTVSLTVTDNAGATNSASQSVTIQSATSLRPNLDLAALRDYVGRASMVTDPLGNLYISGLKLLDGTAGEAFLIHRNPQGSLREASLGAHVSSVGAIGISGDGRGLIISGLVWATATQSFGGLCAPSDVGNGRRLYLARIAKDTLQCEWVHYFSEVGVDTTAVRDMAIDEDGNIVVVGKFEAATINFDLARPETTLSNTTGGFLGSCFIVKFNPAGDHLWSKGFGGPSPCESVETLHNGDILVASTIMGEVNIGSDSQPRRIAPISPALFPRFPSNMETVLIRYTASGAYVWHKQIPGYNRVNSIAVNSTNSEIAVAGNFYNQLDVCSSGSSRDSTCQVAPLNASAREVYIARFSMNNASALMATKLEGTTISTSTGTSQKEQDLAYGPNQNLVLSGIITPLDNTGSHTYLLSLSSSGTEQWRFRFQNSSLNLDRRLTVGPNGEVWMLSGFVNSMDYEGGQAIAPNYVSGQNRYGLALFLIE